ncbi:hypothetical protein PI124_g5112 [Phytophthora idaei]|nr:hypothetical protein PI125_g2771 [Phytophthora idaei]KAG3169605.1 hypothetical protein PI126_g2744 [Phytophthora idaei]KAG3250261.1 hypothetical protein PI124_g5112 [Phytophthora idaei]
MARANKIRSARTEAKQFAEKEKTVTFQDVQSLVADTYSWSSLKSALDDLKLPTISPAVRVLLSHERRPTVTKMLDLEKIEEAKGAIPYDFEDSKTYIVSWKEFGSMTQDQLTVTERIIGLKETLRGIGFTLD